MSKILDIYTNDGLKLTLHLELSSLGVSTLFVHVGSGVTVSAVCEDVKLVTYDSLPNYAFLEMPGCCISFKLELLGDVEAFLAEPRLINP